MLSASPNPPASCYLVWASPRWESFGDDVRGRRSQRPRAQPPRASGRPRRPWYLRSFLAPTIARIGTGFAPCFGPGTHDLSGVTLVDSSAGPTGDSGRVR